MYKSNQVDSSLVGKIIQFTIAFMLYTEFHHYPPLNPIKFKLRFDCITQEIASLKLAPSTGLAQPRVSEVLALLRTSSADAKPNRS